MRLATAVDDVGHHCRRLARKGIKLSGDSDHDGEQDDDGLPRRAKGYEVELVQAARADA